MKKKIKKYVQRLKSQFEIMQVSAFINGVKHTFTDNIINIGEGRYILK